MRELHVQTVEAKPLTAPENIVIDNNADTVLYQFADIIKAQEFYQQTMKDGKDSKLIQPNNSIALGYWSVQVYNN